MLVFKEEKLFDVIAEVDALLKMHYEEVAMHRDTIKLNPMWDDYSALERMGRFVIYTVRENDRLVGYSAFFINKHMHYADTVCAVNDVIFLHPDHRKSTAGYRLIKFSHEQLKMRGDVNKAIWHVKHSKDWSAILHKLGYVDEEKIVGIIFKD